MKKIFNASLTLVVMAVFVCVNLVLTSCSGETDFRESEVITVTKNVPVLIEQDKLVYINELYNCWFDGSHMAVNGAIALTADVEHEMPVIEMPIENHKAAEIVSNNDLSWKDSNGQTTNGTLNKIESNDGSYDLFVALTPAATKYSTLTSLHKKVSMITCNYELTGNLLLHTNDGDVSNPIDFKMQRPYLLVDPSVDVEIINHTDTLIQIEVRVDTLIQEKIITKTDTVEIKVTETVEVPVLKDVYFNGEDITINGAVAATVGVEHQYPTIEMPADQHKKAVIKSSYGLNWSDNNGQQTNGVLNLFKSNDHSYEISALLMPAENYSTLTKVHEKVSMVTTHHTFAGTVKVMAGEKSESKDFSFDLARRYFLVDPSIDIKEVHDSTIVLVRDTIINTVTVTDTVNVVIDRFVKGADVNTSIVNDFGFSTGTLTMGDKQLLQVTLRHESPILDVEKSVFGNVSFSNTAALRWNGTDKQKTSATVNAQGCTVNGVEYLRADYSDISGMKQVRTIYKVWGTYYNENGDTKEFSFEMAPSYLQTYTEVTPSVEPKDVVRYEVVDTYKDKTTGDIKVKKLTLKVTKYVNDVETEKWTYTGNVIISGYVAGYDMYVADASILRKEYTDAEDYDSSYNFSNRPVTGNEKFSESMSSHIWSYKNFFRAHSGGEVNTNSEIRFQSMVVTFTDGDFSWTSKSFEKNVEVVYDQIDQDSELNGTTREESGRHFTYGGTHRLTVKNLVDGEEFFTSTAVSPLYVQD